MTTMKLTLVAGLTLAFLAIQAPHLAFANGGGGGEQEVINQTVFPARHRERKVVRTTIPSQTTTLKTRKVEKTGSKGFLGRLFKKN